MRFPYTSPGPAPPPPLFFIKRLIKLLKKQLKHQKIPNHQEEQFGALQILLQRYTLLMEDKMANGVSAHYELWVRQPLQCLC